MRGKLDVLLAVLILVLLFLPDLIKLARFMFGMLLPVRVRRTKVSQVEQNAPKLQKQQWVFP